MMKILLLSLFLVTTGTAVLAETAAVIAVWSDSSGSLPPEHAWGYKVEYLADGTVRATYCKGYETEAPGCARVKRKLSAAAQKAMGDAIEPYAEDLIDNPPQSVTADEIPVGGGSIGGVIFLDETAVELPSYPRAIDAERVQAVLKILQDSTPINLVKKAQNRARKP
jgi:hypothetical protein